MFDYSDQIFCKCPSQVRQASNIGSTNGSAGMSLFTGNSFDASASDTILGRMYAGIDGSVAGVHLLGRMGRCVPRNSFNQDYDSSLEIYFSWVCRR